jgi:hypothetical protein
MEGIGSCVGMSGYLEQDIRIMTDIRTWQAGITQESGTGDADY